MSFVRRKKIGDLSAYGLPEPEEGAVSRLLRLGVAPAIVDREVVDAIRDGRIEIVAGVESLDESGVQLADGSRIEPDALIAATGFRPGLEPLVGHLGVLDERGAPVATSGEAAPGLRFVGYILRPGQIGLMGREAKLAADDIAERRRSRLAAVELHEEVDERARVSDHREVAAGKLDRIDAELPARRAA
jgi:hypothetical protein